VSGMDAAAGSGVLAIAAGLTAAIAAGMRGWAQRRLLDVPNERSSHVRPTPRGGGLGIVLVVAAGLLALAFASADGRWAAVALAGVSVAAIGLADDLRSLPPLVRLGGFLAIVAAGLAVTGAWTTLELPVTGSLSLGRVGFALSVVWVVGLVNAYNFMDGIDGIAGTQAAVAGAGWAVLGAIGAGRDAGLAGWLLAGSALGFLWHNSPPARIFMGDVGSVFVGFVLAMLPVVAAARGGVWAVAGVLLVWPFVFDALFTFLRRLARDENVLQAHRSHLYQRLVIAGWPHRRTTLLYGGLALAGLVAAVVYATSGPGGRLATLCAVAGLAAALWAGVRRVERRTAPV